MASVAKPSIATKKMKEEEGMAGKSENTLAALWHPQIFAGSWHQSGGSNHAAAHEKYGVAARGAWRRCAAAQRKMAAKENER